MAVLGLCRRALALIGISFSESGCSPEQFVDQMHGQTVACSTQQNIKTSLCRRCRVLCWSASIVQMFFRVMGSDVC